MGLQTILRYIASVPTLVLTRVSNQQHCWLECTCSLHDIIIMDKRAILFLFVKWQPNIDYSVTRIRPSIALWDRAHLPIADYIKQQKIV